MSDMAVAGLVIAGLYVITRQQAPVRQMPAPVAPTPPETGTDWEKIFGIAVTIGQDIYEWWQDYNSDPFPDLR